jgi:hypothetical protein
MPHSVLSRAALLIAVLPLAACSIDVNKHDSGRSADVDIRTPTGTLAVRTSVPAEGTGLAVYPNARPARKHGRDESADVDIDTAWFGVKVVAAKFESDDDPAQVLAFYRDEMARYAPYVECRGHVRWHRNDRPACSDGSSREVELAAGVENRQRIVVVKPQNDGGTEFALVYVSTNN